MRIDTYRRERSSSKRQYTYTKVFLFESDEFVLCECDILLSPIARYSSSISLSARILHRAPPPPAPSGPKFSNSENCCGSENAMPPKIFWDMEGHGGHIRSKNVFFFKKHILEKIHNKSNYFFNF